MMECGWKPERRKIEWGPPVAQFMVGCAHRRRAPFMGTPTGLADHRGDASSVSLHPSLSPSEDRRDGLLSGLRHVRSDPYREEREGLTGADLVGRVIPKMKSAAILLTPGLFTQLVFTVAMLQMCFLGKARLLRIHGGWTLSHVAMGSSLILLEESLPIEARFFDTFQNIALGFMQSLLRRDMSQHVLGCPAPRRFLEGADIEDSIVQMLDDLDVGFLDQERSVSVDGISREQRRSWRGHEFLDIVQQSRRRLLWGRRRGQAGLGQSGGSVRPDAPLVHLIQRGRRLMDYRIPPFLIQQLELIVRDETCNLHDRVHVRIKTSHLPFEVDQQLQHGRLAAIV